MKSGVRRSRRRQKNKGLLILLGGIIAVFAVILVAVGIKFALSGLGGEDTKTEKEDETKILITGIELECDRPVVRAGEEITLNVTVTPANATDKELVWTVSGDMGTVDANGVFTPSVEAGKSDVEITAAAKDGTEVFDTVTIRVLEAIDPLKPMVAITYDDGPHSTYTPQLLDVLEANYAPATFFMVGSNIEGKEDILKRSYNLGNELANHTWDHANLSESSADTITKQLADTDAAIQAVCNVENIILRPPYGAYNSTVKSTCNKPIIMWSVDTLDWKTRSADATYEACMGAVDGDIILMHDIHESTIIAAEDIVKGLQEQGFQLVTVSELYEYRLGEFGPGKVNFKMPVSEYENILAEMEAEASTESMEDTEASETESTENEEGTSESTTEE